MENNAIFCYWQNKNILGGLTLILLRELLDNITIQGDIRIDVLYSDGQSNTIYNGTTDSLTYADIDDKYLDLEVCYMYASDDKELVIELDSEN